MTVIYDHGREFQDSASAAVNSITHTATIANVTGMLVAFIKGGASGSKDNISAVSAGGTTLTRVNRATDTATEPGSAEWWFAAGAFNGQTTVHYNSGAPGSNIHVTIITFTGDATPYVIGAATFSENTASSSVSVTTGYVQGLAFGAFYGGGAEPATLTYGTDFTLVHDWDMGAFYGETFRHQQATPAGTGPTVIIGGRPGLANDDVAFAALFLTDGVIKPGVGAVTMAGLVPEILDPFGEVYRRRVTLVGHIPTLELTLPVDQTVVEPGVGFVTMEGREPALLTEITLTPDVGLTIVQGVAPAMGSERVLVPDVGLATIGGLSGNALGEGQYAPTSGLLVIQGLAPTVSGELTLPGVVNPGVGTAVLQGRTPSALPENAIRPDVGFAQVQGLAPTLELTEPVNAATLEPGVGLVTLDGLAPTVSADEVRSGTYPRKRRRGRSTPIPEYSADSAVAVPYAPPAQPLPGEPIPLRVGLGALAGVDLRRVVVPVKPEPAIDDNREAIRKRRRREEDLILQMILAA